MKIHRLGLPIVASFVLATAASGSILNESASASEKPKADAKTEFINACVTSAKRRGATEQQAQSYCTCFANNLEKQKPEVIRDFFTSVAKKQEPAPATKNAIAGILKTCSPKPIPAPQ